MSIREDLAAPFSGVQWRLQQTHPKNAKGADGKYPPGTRGLFMAYIDARQLYDRLDEVVGVGNWQRIVKAVNPDGSVIGCLRVKIGEEWIDHEDVGYSNNPGASHETEPLKAAASDAFKRAGVGLGIGRFLYDLEADWKPIDAWGRPLNDQRGQVEPELPARTSTTSENTITQGVPEPPRSSAQRALAAVQERPPIAPSGIVSWTEFWTFVEAEGVPRDKRALEAAMGTTLGADPAYALERFQAWRKDMAEQGVLV